jgi:hypothetical protein
MQKSNQIRDVYLQYHKFLGEDLMLVPPTKIDPHVGISNSTHIFDFLIDRGIVSFDLQLQWIMDLIVIASFKIGIGIGIQSYKK